MRSYNQLNNFITDLRDLYCKTHISSIENHFIKLSQSYGQEFLRWISSIDNIKSLLQDPKVADALALMAKLKSTYPAGFNVSNFAEFFVSDRSKKVSKQAYLIPYIVSFSKLMGKSEFYPLLSPFSDIINSSNTVMGAENQIDIKLIEEDLNVVKNEFQKYTERTINKTYDSDVVLKKEKRETIKQKREKMFMFLFQKFSDDISNACNNMGIQKASSEIKNGGLLKLNILDKYLNAGEPTEGMWRQAKRMVKDIWGLFDDKFKFYNYEYVKNKSMWFVGQVSLTDLYILERKREEERELFKNDIYEENKGSKLDYSNSKLINSSFLSMIYAFFAVYYSKVNI